jgi:exoribonuclease II
VFRSSARLTYTKVWDELSSGSASADLQNLDAVFRVLLDARNRRGAIDFETVETRMVFDAKGKIEKIVAEPRNDAHRIIEECMLAANVCAGNFLAEHAHPALYRVHDVPSSDKVAALRDFLAELGLQLPARADVKIRGVIVEDDPVVAEFNGKSVRASEAFAPVKTRLFGHDAGAEARQRGLGPLLELLGLLGHFAFELRDAIAGVAGPRLCVLR